jgi:hypothetical protein
LLQVSAAWAALNRRINGGVGKAPERRDAAAPNLWLVLALACGAIVSAALVFATLYGHGVAADFGALWRAARTEQPYAPDDFAPFAYPPPALMWIKPFGLLPFWPAAAAWSVLSLGCYLAVTRRPLLAVSPAVVQCLLFGQTSMLVAALILSPRMRGFLIGIAMTLKPQLLFLAPLVFAVQGDWRTLVNMACGAALSVAGSILFFGVHSWADWLLALPHFGNVVAERNLWWVTITPYGTAMRFGLNPWPFWIVGAAAAVYAAVRLRADPVFVSVLTSLLASPYAVAHDLVALLPFCLTLLERDGKDKPFAALVFSAAFAPLGLIGLALNPRQGRRGLPGFLGRARGPAWWDPAPRERPNR